MSEDVRGGLAPGRHIEAIAEASARVAGLGGGRGGGLDRVVPACPGWTVADVFWHLIEVHEFWRQVVADGADPSRVTRLAHPGDDRLVGRFADGAEALVDDLRAADPSATVWTWAGPQPVAWVIRRMAHETSIHALDIAAALGAAFSAGYSTEPEIAADGIDEFLSTMLGLQREGQPRPGGSVHLHCTDTPGEWMVEERAGTFEVSRRHAKGSCALRGEAASIMSVLWRRAPLSAIDVIGDAAVADRFVGLVDLA